MPKGFCLPGRRIGIAGLGLSALMALAFASTACVTPKSDYDEWLTRTTDVREVPPPIEGGAPEGGPKETGPVDVEVPTEGFDNLYHVACMPSIFRTSEKALQFQGKLKFTPSGPDAAAGGTLSLVLHPLKADPTTLDQLVGADIGPSPGTRSDTSAIEITVGTITVPGAANPGTGSDILIEDGIFRGTIATADKFCIKMFGKVTQPVQLELGGAKDFCIFQKYDAANATVAVYKKPDFDACQ